MPIPIGFAEAWLQYTIVGDLQPMYTSLGVRIDAPPFSQANADALILLMASRVNDFQSNAYTCVGGHVLVGNDGGDIRFDSVQNIVGNLAGEALPQNCSLLVRKNTGLGGRRNRGRMYIPGLRETDVNSNGTVATGTIAIAQVAMSDLLTAINGGTGGANTDAAVLFHTSAPTVPTTITSLDVQQVIATQRRRLRR